MNLKQQIENYIPFNEQEKRDKDYFIKWLNTFKDCLTRENEFGHFSSSAFVVNKEKNKMLVVYHNIFGAWIYPGGHADGEEDLLSVAIREVKEETGLKAKPLDTSIFGIQSLAIDGHVKKGMYVPAHVHLDVVYLLEGNDQENVFMKEDENKGVQWINFEEAVGNDMCDFIRPVHERLIKKLIKR